MGISFKLPNITAKNEAAQIAQIKNYLFQLIGELNYKLSVLEAGTSSESALERTEILDYLNSNRPVVESDNFKVNKDGSVTAKKLVSENITLKTEGVRAVTEIKHSGIRAERERLFTEVSPGEIHIGALPVGGNETGEVFELMRFDDINNGGTYRLAARGSYNGTELVFGEPYIEKI
jgi:hypothetical protein